MLERPLRTSDRASAFENRFRKLGNFIMVAIMVILFWFLGFVFSASPPMGVFNWQEVTIQGLRAGVTRKQIASKLGPLLKSEGGSESVPGLRFDYGKVELFIVGEVITIIGTQIEHHEKILAEVAGLNQFSLLQADEKNDSSSKQPVYRRDIVRLFGEPEAYHRQPARSDNEELDMVYGRPYTQFASTRDSYPHEFVVSIAPGTGGMVRGFSLSWKGRGRT